MLRASSQNVDRGPGPEFQHASRKRASFGHLLRKCWERGPFQFLAPANAPWPNEDSATARHSTLVGRIAPSFGARITGLDCSWNYIISSAAATSKRYRPRHHPTESQPRPILGAKLDRDVTMSDPRD
ncbi:hypothetical protein CGRA01v4_01598 [Colletotrichum graminicola]|nr:hypothetical protein CGRA01v4_01598 [Colletotrichum graminicola]